MIRTLLAILLALAVLAPARAMGLYVLAWQSEVPVQITSIEVTGGALISVYQDGSGLSGAIAAASEQACVTIKASGQTTAGWAVRFAETWDEGCARVYLPMVEAP